MWKVAYFGINQVISISTMESHLLIWTMKCQLLSNCQR